MNDSNKTKAQLIDELQKLRARVAQLEAEGSGEIERPQTEQDEGEAWQPYHLIRKQISEELLIADKLGGEGEQEEWDCLKELHEVTHHLGERIKELNCLYGISKLVERPATSLAAIFQGTIELIPPAWLYPEITCARVNLEDRVFTTANFKETVWKQTSPIMLQGEPVGTVEVGYLEERPPQDEGPFLKEERHLIEAIAERLGKTVERIRIREALRQSEALNRAILESLPDMLFQLKRDGTFLRFKPAKDFEPMIPPREFLGKNIAEVMPADHARQSMRYIELTLQTEKMHFFEYQLEINGEPRDYEVRYVPYGGDEVLAIVRDITERKQAEAEKIRLFEAINEQRDQLRALTGRLAETREDERKALARELHDQVGQNLTALNLNLNIIGTRLAGIDSTITEPVQTLLEDSLVLVEQTAERVHNLMTHLRPPVLDDYGLMAALQWYGAQLTRRINFNITVRGEEPAPRLASAIENALFRIAQEALTNVIKHAQANQVTVSVEACQKSARLIITDDGLGFDPAAQTNQLRHQSWGLITMAERAEAVGGRCRITSCPGQGTKVMVEVPR